MYVREAGGVVSSPARGRWMRRLGLADERTRVRTRHGEREVYVRGVEREVMSHLAVIADPPERPVETNGGGILLDGLPPLRLQTAGFGPARPLRIGPIREWIYPAGQIAIGFLLLVLLVQGVRRISSARAARRAPKGAARTRPRSSRR